MNAVVTAPPWTRVKPRKTSRAVWGVTVRHVQGRLRLADLAEPIFNALAEGKITVDVAKAYGSSSDRDVQLAAWNNFKDHWQGDQPHTIRRYVTDSAVEATSAVARLVGEADYLAAGGRIERDLFAGDGEGQWLDRPIAEELARAKLEQAAAEIMQLGTLGWVRVVLAQHVPITKPKDSTIIIFGAVNSAMRIRPA